MEQLRHEDPDPHGRITFSSNVGPGDINVSPEGHLTWAATYDVDSEITVTVTDGCEASSSKNISLNVYNCKCENNGDCHPVQHAYRLVGHKCQCNTTTIDGYCYSTVIGRWSNWEDCDNTCADENRMRTRFCTGRRCRKHSQRHHEECDTHPCPGWSPWSDCSASCAGGKRRRIRTCDKSVVLN